MLRASKKIAHGLLRSTRDQARAEKPKPEKKDMKIYLTMNDRVGLPFLKHWNATRGELHVGIDKGAWESMQKHREEPPKDERIKSKKKEEKAKNGAEKENKKPQGK
jgi:hypothetical protein